MDQMGTHATAGTSAIVLAGIHRWDDSAFDELLPRPLMPVVHTPLICHLLGWLRNAGVARATICANSASAEMRHVLRDGAALGIDLDYYEDWMPRGPAGCVHDSAVQADAERFVVADGTILPDCDLERLLDEHGHSGAAMTVVAARDSEVSNGSRQRLVPVGVYFLECSVLEQISEAGYQDIKEVLLPRLHERNVPVRIHTLPTPCPRITDADSYITVNGWALEQLVEADRIPSDYRRIGRSVVHESVRLPSPNGLVGAVLIGPGTTIARGAMLVGPTALGAECVIEPGAVVCNSVVWDGCRVGRGAAVNHSVLGNAVQVEAEAILLHTVSAGRQDQYPQPRVASRLESLLFPASLECDGQRASKRGVSRPTANLPPRSSAEASTEAVSL